MSVEQLARAAKSASIQMAGLSSDAKNKALALIGEALRRHASQIMRANSEDLALAEKNNLVRPLLKRLKFDEKKIDTVCSRQDSCCY